MRFRLTGRYQGRAHFSRLTFIVTLNSGKNTVADLIQDFWRRIVIGTNKVAIKNKNTISIRIGR